MTRTFSSVSMTAAATLFAGCAMDLQADSPADPQDIARAEASLSGSSAGSCQNNVALGANTSDSSPGWGGGARPQDLTDGQTAYPSWARGLAFRGGDPGWAGSCGVKYATVDFGTIQTVDRVLAWHHGPYQEHVPHTAWIEYWDGAAWQSPNDTWTVRWDLENSGTGLYAAVPTEHTFIPVQTSRVRFVMNNCGMSGHGWLYELEVFGCPLKPRILLADVEPTGTVEMGESYSVLAAVENPAPTQETIKIAAIEMAANTDTFGLGDTPLQVRKEIVVDSAATTGPHYLKHQHQWHWLGKLNTCDELGALISVAPAPLWVACQADPNLQGCLLKALLNKAFGTALGSGSDLVDALVPIVGMVRSNTYSYVVRASDRHGEDSATAGSMRVSVSSAKQGLLASYVATYALSAVASAILATSAALPLQKSVQKLFGFLAGVGKAIACYNFNAAYDPVPDYKMLATPQTIPLTDLQSVLPAEHLVLSETLLAALAYTRALEATMIRLQGAKAAGDLAWINRHTRMFEMYTAAISEAYAKAAKLLTGTVADLQLTLGEADARQAAASLQQQGLAQETVAVLELLRGVPGDTRMLASDAGLMLDTLADATSERALGTLLLNASEIHRALAEEMKDKLQQRAGRGCGDKMVTDHASPQLQCALDRECPSKSENGSSHSKECDDGLLRVSVAASDDCDPTPATQVFIQCDDLSLPTHAGDVIDVEVENDDGHGCRIERKGGRLMLEGSSVSLVVRAIDASGNVAECRAKAPNDSE